MLIFYSKYGKISIALDSSIIWSINFLGIYNHVLLLFRNFTMPSAHFWKTVSNIQSQIFLGPIRTNTRFFLVLGPAFKLKNDEAFLESEVWLWNHGMN